MSTVSLDSLSWIKTELERTLETARQRLDAFAEEPERHELLTEFVERIHQVAGTLTMVEVQGGRMLAEHMESLAKAVTEGRLRADRDNLEPLMRGSLELTDYLERMVSGMRDSPAVLLPITNEIRSRLGQSPLARERLGRPAPVLPRPAPPPGAESAASLAARLRPRYQAALLAFYQGSDGGKPIARMREAAGTIEAAATSPVVFEFYWVVGGLLEALAEGGLTQTLSVKRLLGQVERELKRLAASSEAAVAEEPPEALTEEILGEIEHATSSGERVAAIRANFDLAKSESDDEAPTPTGPSSTLLRSVGRAILEDLGRVRDRIDIFVRTGRKNPADLVPLSDTLKKVADALGMLGLAEPRARVEHEREAVAALAEGAQMDEASLLSLATELIGIESDVEGFLVESGEDAQTAAARGARVAGLREILADISRIKDVVTERVRNTGHPERLTELPQLADQLARTLDFLALSDAVPLMHRVARYLEQLSERGGLPERIELDRLADAVVSVEYYIETLQRGRKAPASMLENADRALSALGVREGAPPPPAAPPPSAPRVAARRPPAAPPVRPPPAPEAGELPPVREEGADEEIVDVFIEEAAEVGKTLAEVFPRWRENPNDADALTVVRRSFHTLKGSGRMVGAKRLGEFAWTYENLLNHVIDHTMAASDEIVTAVARAVGAVPQLLEQFRSGKEPRVDVAKLLETGQRLASGEGLAGGTAEAAAPAPEAPTSDRERPESKRIEEPAEKTAPAATGEPSAVEEAGPARGARIDAALYDVYRRETEAHLATVRAWLKEVEHGRQAEVTFELRRAAHTLSGSARMAGVTEMDLLISPLDRLFKAAEMDGAAVGTLVPDIQATVDVAAQLLEAYGAADRPLPEWEPVRDRLEAHAAKYAEVPHESLEDRAYTESLLGEEPEELDLSRKGAKPGRRGRDRAGRPGEVAATGPDSMPRPRPRPTVVVQLKDLDSYDAELATVFMGEAGELLEGADHAVHTWLENHDLTEPLTDLLRRLHTLKGGARMAGVTPVADLAHELESLLIRVSDGRVAVSGELLRLVERTFDRLHRMLEHAAGDGRIPLDATVVTELRRQTQGEPARPLEEAEEEAEARIARRRAEEQEVKRRAAAEEAAAQEAEAKAEPSDGAERRGGPRLRHEMARVRADLLETSINAAGEVSIYRSRIEQQLLGMNLHLGELDRTVERVRSQLRELEIETEAQILAVHRTESTADFDPLEFDRYTRIHELSRSLAEAVADLTSLRSLFATELRQSNVLLERQGRVNVDLQDALMRTRMVPFSLSAARLRRVVRQVAEEVGKKAELRLAGVEGEMDRQVLEHILPALEHLLRNAVVHGIESPELRRSRGKPVAGRINLTLSHEGGDVIIEVADDGGGLDLPSIRAKAEKEGIIQSGVQLTDEEIAELVFRPGFSTAGTVTQAAGRGVGMDVVAAEARQVGGSAEIASKPFEGTRCRMRLPVTLAITQTLLVRIGRTRYPVPLASITGVQRVSRAQLDELLEQEDPVFAYGDEIYDLVSLTSLLGEDPAGAEEEVPRVPLLLVSLGGRNIAFIADDMEGSREIVVKPVGPQIGHIPGIAGATIFGDGTIGLLLDLSAMVRALPQTEAMTAPPPPAEKLDTGYSETVIMVVDDSITVRRVTQRMLERRGARVLTAKDGVEALELLQDHTPDVMLLDIEMPRMDGYELAGHMKNDSRMRDIPIIVITSRTGDKHRARATQIGIDRYLGKPYQEAELLEAIKSVVGGFNPLSTRTSIETHADFE